MSWEDLLQTADEKIVVPWFGMKHVHTRTRMLAIKGRRPRRHGWFEWKLFPRHVELIGDAEPDLSLLFDRTKINGYLVGDRFAPDGTTARIEPTKVAGQLERVHLIDPGLERFTRVTAARVWTAGELIFVGPDMPLGPEPDVLQAFYDGAASVDHIKGVTPSLDAAFRLERHRRAEEERAREELERLRREEEERIARENARAAIAKQLGDGAGRREMARIDFLAAARAALAVSDAKLVDWRHGATRNEFVVTYDVDHERLQCVVDETLHVIDAGICLQDHGTGRKGDKLFTLESLPSVVREAMREDKLVKWRHA